MEFLPILEIALTKYSPDTNPYVIVPLLPGYAFSSPPPLSRDFQLQGIAFIMNLLMVEVGFGGGHVV